MDIRVPLPTTLQKYGLTINLFLAIWEHQGRKCPICGKEPKTGGRSEFNIDHEHVRGYANMSDEDRRFYVRGIVCQWCNRSYMAKHMTIEKAQNIILYLGEYNDRQPDATH